MRQMRRHCMTYSINMGCHIKPIARAVIRLLWLLIFAMAVPDGDAFPRADVPACHSERSFHYDAQYRGNICYDKSPSPSLCYDKAIRFSASTAQSGLGISTGQFGRLGEFLAAEGGTGARLALPAPSQVDYS